MAIGQNIYVMCNYVIWCLYDILWCIQRFHSDVASNGNSMSWNVMWESNPNNNNNGIMAINSIING